MIIGDGLDLTGDPGANGWAPIETAPTNGKSFLAFIPIKGHRLVIAFYSKQGVLLNENCIPIYYPASLWHPLPARPGDDYYF